MYNQTLELSNKAYKNNIKEYKKLIKEQFLEESYTEEKEEVIEYVNEWLVSFVKRLLYVHEFGLALKLYAKSIKINKFK